MSNVIYEIYKDSIWHGTVCKYEGFYFICVTSGTCTLKTSQWESLRDLTTHVKSLGYNLIT